EISQRLFQLRPCSASLSVTLSSPTSSTSSIDILTSAISRLSSARLAEYQIRHGSSGRMGSPQTSRDLHSQRHGQMSHNVQTATSQSCADFSLQDQRPLTTRVGPNNAFKPKPLRSTKHMADTACHVLGSTTQLGLT